LLLPETERVASRIFLLPTGQTVDVATIEIICGIIRKALSESTSVRAALRQTV